MTDTTDAIVEAMARAGEAARRPGREGPYGGYDYGHNTEFYGPAPEGGRYVIRDFRDPASQGWGKWVHQTHDNAEHEAEFERLTLRNVYSAALAAALPMLREDVERAHRTAQYDPAPYTKGKAAIRARFDAIAKEINP